MSMIQVLIVDDDTLLCRMITRILSGEGYCCTSATGAKEAMEMLRTEHYDLLISDVMMPYVSGNELLRNVTKKFPELPVIMMSGKDNDETFARCLTNQSFGYLKKPFSNNQLIVNVKNVLLIGEFRRKNRILNERLQEIQVFAHDHQ